MAADVEPAEFNFLELHSVVSQTTFQSSSLLKHFKMQRSSISY